MKPSTEARGARSVEVTDSWQRCAGMGLGPESPLPPVDLLDLDLADYRDRHALAPAMPLIRRMLAQHAVDDGLIVAVGDATGRVLWVEGPSGVLRRAEHIHFTEGARWGERDAGTNAPALALTLDRAVRVRSAEHLFAPVKRWSCSAAPVHDRNTGETIGFVDVTGAPAAASASLLALVQLTVDTVEATLADSAVDPGATLEVLGRRQGMIIKSGRRYPLSCRHSEILLLLGAHPGGVSADELAVLLDERELDPVTVRAEMTRLRRTVGDELVGNRPYRLRLRLDSDISRVRRLLGQRRVYDAVLAYSGPVLPKSTAPGVEDIRANLAAELRAAVMLDGHSDTLLAWAQSDDGRDDMSVWTAAARLLEPTSAQLPFVLGRISALRRRHRSGGVAAGAAGAPGAVTGGRAGALAATPVGSKVLNATRLQPSLH